MGKLIRNGVEFGGSAEGANRVLYDNTNSELQATNVQTAIDRMKEIADSLGLSIDELLDTGIIEKVMDADLGGIQLPVPLYIYGGLPEINGALATAPSGYSGYGRTIAIGSSTGDKYYILVDSARNVWTGNATNDAINVTWTSVIVGDYSDGTITVVNGTNWQYTLNRQGKLVVFSATFNVSSASDGMHVCTLPVGYRPVTGEGRTYIEMAGYVQNANDDCGALRITSQGAVHIFNPTNLNPYTGVAYIHAVFMTV